MTQTTAPLFRPSLPPSEGETEPVPIFPVGQIVGGGYEVRGLLGEGGMGQVLDAYDLHLRRRVAIKVPLQNVDDTVLRREGQALAALRHPSVVAVHAFGHHEGRPYLVLEHLSGVSLEEYAAQRRERGNPVGIAETVDLLIRVAEGLAVIHEAGVSHRDIKPSNVMLVPGNRLVLMDFGLVLPEIHVRRNEHVAGSLGYMAPEVLTGAVRPGRGHLTDLYALGVVAFELLTGTLPYDDEDPAVLVKKQLRGGVPDPSALRPSLPPHLVALVRELLVVDPRERLQTAENALWLLRRLQRQLAALTDADRFTVLIVDDDPDMWEPLSVLVRSVADDAVVKTAMNGKQALRLLRRIMPTVLLIDIDLPDLNGIELSMYVRGMPNGAQTHIVAVSGRASERDVSLLRQLGVAFVQKGPSMSDALVAELSKRRSLPAYKTRSRRAKRGQS
jgi:serine/threonine protein kinase